MTLAASQSTLLQKVSLLWDSAFLYAVLSPKLKDLQISIKQNTFFSKKTQTFQSGQNS